LVTKNARTRAAAGGLLSRLMYDVLRPHARRRIMKRDIFVESNHII
jgi:hypothetical protein